MGMLIDGRWESDDVSSTAKDGSWRRAPSSFRNWLQTSDADDSQFPAAPSRYHLYAAWNCPWAHRALLVRNAKGLTPHIAVSFAKPARSEQGWIFASDGEFRDRLFGVHALHELYTRADPGFTGRVTVPVLWDTETDKIVSNESADIVRMFNDAFARWTPGAVDLYPESHRREIEQWNERIHRTVNNGVYRAGFATSQAAYDEAVSALFETLELIERTLQQSRYLCGDDITEADWRLFPTLARFDVAYHSAFKCNLKRITDFPALWKYARQLYHWPGVKDTVRFDVYRAGYHSKSEKRNPHGIVPIGPQIAWNAA
ncbi:MAG: glutathione S-transferase C-terminal domain-containing protein [Pseudomonadota bacterium]